MITKNNSQVSVEDNLQISREDLGHQRRGANGMSHHLFLIHATTEELVVRDVKKLMWANEDKTFRLELDGIAGFAVFVDDVLLLQSDFYAVERYYRQDAKNFYLYLKDKMQEMLEIQHKQ